MSEQDFARIFAKNLEKYMTSYELSQSDLARRLGVSQTSVFNWIHGVKIPRMDKIDALCQIFHCTREALITDSGATVAGGIYAELLRKIKLLDYEDAVEIEAIIDLKLGKEKYKKINAG